MSDCFGSWIYGVELSKKYMEFQQERASCMHDERFGNAYCPICGKKVLVRKETVIPDWINHEEAVPGFPELRVSNGDRTFLIGIPLRTSDFARDDGDLMWLGSGGDDNQFLEVPTMSDDDKVRAIGLIHRFCDWHHFEMPEAKLYFIFGVSC